MGAAPPKVALVTGASRGIGRAIALELGRAGYHVIALARTVGALEELDDAIRAEGGAGATLVPLDLTDFDALDRLGAAVHERWGKLDALIGNAGVLGPVTPVAHIKPADWDKAVAINLTANYRLIRSFDPLLQAAPAGRALFLTSNAANQARAYLGPYCITKTALEILVRSYVAEVAQTPVKANLLNPGATRTAMRAQFMPGEDPSTLPGPEEIAPLAVCLVGADISFSGEVVSYRDWRDGKGPLRAAR